MAEETIQEDNNRQLLSDEMNNFLRYKPHWIVRKGSALFLFVFLFLIIIASFIEYPDIVKGTMRIVSVNSPKLLTAKTEGTLKKLLVANDQEVHVGQHLAFLQSTADHEQVLLLYQWIEKMDIKSVGNLEILIKDPLPVCNNLGEVQPSYQTFENILKETQQILSQGFYQKKLNDLQRDLADINEVQNVNHRQKELLNKDLELQKVEYNAKQSLEHDKIIASLEFNQDKSKLLMKEQSIEQLNATLANNTILIHNKEKEIRELYKFISDQHQAFHTALLDLKSKIQDWMQKYIITAVTDGKLSYVSYLQEKQFIQNSQELFYIIPASNQFYGELKVGQAGIGKIKTGQKVIVRVNSFPSEEFGFLTGKISYIPSLIKNDSSTLIKVDFVNGLKTNYNKELLFKDNMNASAEIITRNRKLVDRFMGKLKEIGKR